MSTPAEETVGVVSTLREDGTLASYLRPLEECVEESGDIAAGVLFVLADTLLGHVGIRRLPPDRFMVTSNLHLDLVARPARSGGNVVGAASVDAVDDFGVLCRSDLHDAAGRLIAVTTGRFAVVAQDSRHAGTVTSEAARLPPVPRAADTEAPASASAIHRLLGLRPVHRDGPTFQFAMTARPELSNERGGLHGGVGALVGEQAAGFALRTALPEGGRMRPVDIRACFFRPVEASGTTIACTAEVLHVGRRLAAARARVATADGRLAVLVDVLYAPVGGQ
jgi:uncharacterized protein (TIGR00369 family)